MIVSGDRTIFWEPGAKLRHIADFLDDPLECDLKHVRLYIQWLQDIASDMSLTASVRKRAEES